MSDPHTLNGVDLDRLTATIEAITGDGSLARFEFRVDNRWIDGGHSRTQVKGFFGAGQEDTTRTEAFVLEADEPPVLLGHNLAANAGEYLLQALAACLTGTIVYHAAARGIALDGLECAIEGEVDLRGFLGLDAAVRPGFGDIRATVTARGDLDEAQLAVLAGLAAFSPVRDSILNPVPVTVEVVRGAAARHG